MQWDRHGKYWDKGHQVSTVQRDEHGKYQDQVSAVQRDGLGKYQDQSHQVPAVQWDGHGKYWDESQCPQCNGKGMVSITSALCVVTPDCDGQFGIYYFLFSHFIVQNSLLNRGLS